MLSFDLWSSDLFDYISQSYLSVLNFLMKQRPIKLPIGCGLVAPFGAGHQNAIIWIEVHWQSPEGNLTKDTSAFDH